MGDLMNISRTTLSSKILAQHKEFFAKMCVDAVVRLKGSGNLQAIQIIKKQGGTLTDSFLDNGFLLDKKIGLNQPKRVENARILIANTPMDTDKIKVFGSRIRVDSVAKVAELELAEKEKMKEKVDLILKHDCTVFINRQLIYNYPEQLFSDAGVMAIEGFAKALRALPTVIADNAGYDSAQLISELRAAHAQGKHTMGLNMDVGKVDCMKQVGVTESFMVKRQVLVSAAEAAEMILRVDDIIKAAPRRREQDRSHC